MPSATLVQRLGSFPESITRELGHPDVRDLGLGETHNQLLAASRRSHDRGMTISSGHRQFTLGRPRALR